MIIGNGIILMSVNLQSIQNMVASVKMMESKSATMGIRPSAKISLILSISLMVRVVRVPMGVLSNWLRFKLITFLYTVTRKSFTTFWPTKAVTNENIKRRAVSIKRNTT